MQQKRIAIVNQSSGFLVIDVVNAYAEAYEEVVLIAGKVTPVERQLNPKVRVEEIAKYDRSSAKNRILTWLKGYFGIRRLLKGKYKGWEVLYFTNPPMSYFAAKGKYSIGVYDLYPDALQSIGIKPSNPIYKCWARKNRKLFAGAERVITLGEGMKKAVSQYVDGSKVEVVYNWSATDSFKPIPKAENPFAKEHGLEDKFVVMYSGNMGYTHSVDKLVDVARLLKGLPEIHFLFVGGGKKKADIEQSIEKDGLNNCTVLDWQPNEMLPYSLATADLGVITLGDESAAVSVPSKTYNLLAVGAPLLCICPEEAEMRELVGKFGNGKCFMPSDVEGMAEYIKGLYSDKDLLKKYSEASLEAAKSFSFENAKLYI